MSTLGGRIKFNNDISSNGIEPLSKLSIAIMICRDALYMNREGVLILRILMIMADIGAMMKTVSFLFKWEIIVTTNYQLSPLKLFRGWIFVMNSSIFLG